MSSLLAFYQTHGLLALFVAVFVEQVGAPIPAYPFLLLPGAQWLPRWFPAWTVPELDFGNGVPAGDNARLHPLPLPLEESGAPQERVPPAAWPESKPE